MRRLTCAIQDMPLCKRLTFLVVLALTGACIILTYALNVSGDQMVYTIYQSQTTVIPGSEHHQLPTVSRNDPSGSGTILLPQRSADPSGAAHLKYRIESVIYVVCTVAVAAIATYMITENCLNPLVSLKERVAHLDAGNLSSPESLDAPRTRDEVENLANAFQQMRLRLDEAFETQKRFSASAAHELRTPLAVIQTKLDVFSKRKSPTIEEYQALVESIRGQTERLSLLVKDLLDLSCMEEVSMDDAVEFSSILREVAQELSPAAVRREITFSVQGDGLIFGNERLLTKVVCNLAENAIKYGRTHGTIYLWSENDGNLVRVQIRDDGPGIPKEHWKKVFEPFYRVDKSRARAMGGAGLGLPMTKAVVERHGGTITLSTAPEGGACFTLTFPLAQPEEDASLLA